ncbi:MAG: tetraacyldisaccharide 4'-kinase [Ferrimonas sp.]
MQAWLERAWQQGHPLLYALWPFMLLFGLISRSRRWLYRHAWLPVVQLPVPVIVVGNISVGGNGKTPVVLYLVERLRQAGYRPGIISRGYGGDKQLQPMAVFADSDPRQCGDEPLLLAQRSGVPLMVGADRIAAAQRLLADNEIDVIISDDGMQHYRLGRTIEIAVVDGQRRFGNGHLLPMGPLRESPARLLQCDLIICNGGQPKPNEHLMTLAPQHWQRVDGQGEEKPQGQWIAMAGIGYPQRFFDTLTQQGAVLHERYEFVDHQRYTHEMLAPLADAGQSLLMTEKDAVKCRGFALANWYYLPVSATLSATFDQQLLTLLKEKRDGL